MSLSQISRACDRSYSKLRSYGQRDPLVELLGFFMCFKAFETMPEVQVGGLSGLSGLR